VAPSARRKLSETLAVDSRTKFFLLLMTLHGSLLVTSTIAGAKVFQLPFGLAASATVVSYVLTFVILDTIAELYGRSYSRFVINMGLLGMAVSASYVELAVLLPPAAEWRHQDAFATVLEASIRIWFAGWLAYILSQNLDLWSFLKLKDLTTGRGGLALRAWLSMLLGQLVDTAVFVTIAFYGIVPLGSVLVGQYMIKVIAATCAAPLVLLAVWIGRKWGA